MGVSTFSRRLLKRLRERSPELNRRRRPAPLSVRGLERRIVLDGTIATGGGSVDITLPATGTNLNVTHDTFDIDGKPGAEDVYRFTISSGSWNGGASGPIDLDGSPGAEAFISGKDLYVSASFLETNAGGLSITGAINNFSTSLGTSITTTGNQDFNTRVQLTTDATLTGPNVSFTEQVGGQTHDLKVDGNASFGNSAGDTVTGLDVLTVTGTTAINTNAISTDGTQTYTGAVTIGATAGTANLTTTNDAVLFDSSVSLNSNLTVNAGSGGVNFTGTVDGGNGLSINSTGDTIFNGAVGGVTPLAVLITDAGGTTEIDGGGIHTINVQIYRDDVELGANSALSGTLISFNGKVIGDSHSLGITGNAIFGDAAADTVTGLSSLSVSGTTTINTTTVTSTGSQTYTGAATIGAPAGLVTLTTTNSQVEFGSTTTLKSDLTVTTGSGNIKWDGAIDGGFDLIANSTGTTIFSGPVGSVTPLTSLTTNAGGTTQINGGSVVTSGDQIYGDIASLGANTILTSQNGEVEFLGTVTGNSKSLEIDGKAVFGDAAGDSVTGLTTLLVTGSTEINTSTVTSSGSQTYQGAVSIGSSAGTATLTTTDSAVSFNTTVSLLSNLTVTTGSGPVTFTGKVDGPQDLVVNSTGNTTFTAAVGSITPLNSLSTNAGGTTFLNGGSVTTQLDQSYGDNVSLGTNTVLISLAGAVAFLGTVTGNSKSLEIDGNAVFGDAPADTVTGLTTLLVTGSSQINTSDIESTGSQTYDGDVKLGTNAKLTTSLATFNGKIVGVSHSLLVDGDAVFGDAAGDTVTGLTTLEITGASTINTNTVTSSGSQTYHGSVTIGASAGTATLTTTNSAVDFDDTVTMSSNLTVSSGSGAVTFSGKVDGPWDLIVNSTGNTTFTAAVGSITPLHSLTTNAGGTTFINGGSVTTQLDQTYGDAVSLGANSILTSQSGVVSFLGTVAGNGHSLKVQGDAMFGDEAGDAVTGLTTLLVTGSTEINTSTVTTSGTQTYTGAVTVGAPAGTATLTTTDSAVLFDDTVTLFSNLIVSAGSGPVTFAGKVDGTWDLVVNSTGNTTFSAAVGSLTPLHSLTADAGGTTFLNGGSVTTQFDQTYGDSVSLGTNTILISLAGAVTFLGTVTGNAKSLEIDGNAVFGDETTDTLTGLSTLHVTGTSQINTSDIQSTGTQTYDGQVTLGTNVTLTASLVTFNGKVVGAGHSLEIDADAVFGDAPGDTVTGLTTLDVTGASTINTNTVTTSGTQTYHGEVTIGSPAGTATLTTTDSAVFFDDAVQLLSNLTITTGSGPVTFSGKVDGPWDLVVNSTGNTTFSAAVGSATPLHSLTTNAGGTTFLNGGSVTTQLDQTYADNVSLGVDTLLTSLAETVRFLGTVTGNANSLEIDGNAVFGDAPADTVTGLTTLLVTGTTLINTNDIQSTGAQTFDGDVTLGTNVTLTASLAEFHGKVIGGGHSLIIDGDAIFGDDAGDTVTGLTTLEVFGTTAINTNTVTTAGTQTYHGAVTIGAPAGTATLTTSNSTVLFDGSVTLFSNLTVTTGSGPVTFSGKVDGPWDLVVNSTGNTTISAAVGSTAPLHSLTTNAGGTTFLNGGSVSTQLDQTYGDNVSLGANTVLTSLAGTVRFLGTVTGNAESLEIDGNAVFGDAAGDTVTGLASLFVSKTTTINTTTVTSTGSQTYTGAVTIGAPAGLVTLTTTDSPVTFGSTTKLQSDLTVTAGSGNITWGGAMNGAFDLIANSTGKTIFNGPVGNLTKLTSVTTNAGGVTQINGGGVHTSGNQLYHDDVQIGPGTQLVDGDVIHFFGGVDGRDVRLGDLNITSANAVLFDKPVGALRDPGSIRVHAVDITFAAGTYIEVGESAAESVHIVATGTLVLPTGFVVRAAYNGSDYDGVANTFLPRPQPGVPDTALVDLPKDRPVFSSKQNLDQSSTGTIELTVGNPGERGLRVFVDWGNPVQQDSRFEGPGGWADGDGKGDNTAAGDLYAIDGGSTISLTHTYTQADAQAQLKIDNDFDVKYAVYQHESIVIEAARVEQGGQSLGTPGGPLTVLTTTMIYQNAADPRFEPPPPGTNPDLVNGTAAINLSPGTGGVPFEFPVQRPEVVVTPFNDARPLEPLVTFQQVTKDEGSTSAPVVGREQRFVLRLLSPDPTAPPLAEVELPPDSFQADRLQRLFKELPDGAYEIDLLLGENTERPILRFDIRQGRPVVPQESLDGGQLRLEDIEETLKKNSEQPAPAPAPIKESSATDEKTTSLNVEEATDSPPAAVAIDAEEGNSSQSVRPAGTMSSRLEWQLRRRSADREASLTLASRLVRRLSS